MVTPAPQVSVTQQNRAVRLWSGGMMLSGILGVFCGVTGLLLNLMFLLGIAENKGLIGLLSIWLLVLAFPMLWLTSHCLDKVDALDKQIRLRRCGRSGIDSTSRRPSHSK